MGIGSSAKKEAFIAGAEDARRSYIDRRLAEIEVASVDNKPIEPVQWLWKPYFIQNELHMFTGMPNAGKSTLLAGLVTIMSRGEYWPDRTEAPRLDVLWLTGEEAVVDIMARLKAAGCSRGVSVVGRKSPLDLPDDQPVLEALIMKHKADVIVVDPLPSLYSSELSKQQYIDSVVRKQVLVPLTKMLEATNCTAFIIEHPNKKGEESSAMLRSSGSIGKVAFMRAAFFIAPEPDDEDGMRVMACVKSNYAATPPPIRFKITSGEGGRGVAEFIPPSESRYNWTADELVSGKKKSPTACEDALIKLLTKAGPEGMPRAEVLSELASQGFTQRTIDRVRGNKKWKDVIVTSKKTGNWIFQEQF